MKRFIKVVVVALAIFLLCGIVAVACMAKSSTNDAANSATTTSSKDDATTVPQTTSEETNDSDTTTEEKTHEEVQYIPNEIKLTVFTRANNAEVTLYPISNQSCLTVQEIRVRDENDGSTEISTYIYAPSVTGLEEVAVSEIADKTAKIAVKLVDIDGNDASIDGSTDILTEGGAIVLPSVPYKVDYQLQLVTEYGTYAGCFRIR